MKALTAVLGIVACATALVSMNSAGEVLPAVAMFWCGVFGAMTLALHEIEELLETTRLQREQLAKQERVAKELRALIDQKQAEINEGADWWKQGVKPFGNN